MAFSEVLDTDLTLFLFQSLLDLEQKSDTAKHSPPPPDSYH